MSHVMEFFTKTTLEQYRLPATHHPTERIILFISSIARTNLEADLVQKGGSLVRASESSSEYSSTTGNAPLNTNKPKYVFGTFKVHHQSYFAVFYKRFFKIFQLL